MVLLNCTESYGNLGVNISNPNTGTISTEIIPIVYWNN
jgi:hypothetical protein